MQVWKQLQYIMRIVVKYEPTQEECSTFSSKATQWGNLYIKCFGAPAVTPYIHILCAHVGSFLEQYGSIGKFGNWAAEGLHSEVKYTVLHNSPRSGGGVSNKGPAFYALKEHCLEHILRSLGVYLDQRKRSRSTEEDAD